MLLQFKKQSEVIGVSLKHLKILKDGPKIG